MSGGGGLRALVDVRFKRRATPRLVRWLYASALLWIGGGCFFGVNLVWWLASFLGDSFFVFVPVVIAGSLAALTAVRVGCEWMLSAVGEPVPEPPQDRPKDPQQPPVPPVPRQPVAAAPPPSRPLWSQPQPPPQQPPVTWRDQR